MMAFSAILRVTLRQILGRRRLIVLALLAAIPAVVTWFLAADGSPSNADEFHELLASAVLFMVMPIVAIVFGAAALGDERRSGTLSFIAVRPINRSVITTAKFTAVWIAAATIAVGSGGLASAALSVRISDWATLVPALVSIAIAVGCWAAVFITLGFLTSRAVLIGLVYIFVWENGVAFAADSLANLSLSRIGLTAYAALMPESVGNLEEYLGALQPGVGGGRANVAGSAAASIFATAMLLRRRDIA
jgi:ABC-2 type transport system permease protein